MNEMKSKHFRLVRLVVHERDEVETLVEKREGEVDLTHGRLRIDAEDVLAHGVDPFVVLPGHILELQIAFALLVQFHVVGRRQSAVIRRVLAHEMARHVELEPAAVLLDVRGVLAVRDAEEELAGHQGVFRAVLVDVRAASAEHDRDGEEREGPAVPVDGDVFFFEDAGGKDVAADGAEDTVVFPVEFFWQFKHNKSSWIMVCFPERSAGF